MADILRKQLVYHLEGGSAFYPVDQFIRDIPFGKTGVIPEGLPYSLWQLLVHIKIVQKDILEFILDPGYKEMAWPEDYWPEDAAPLSASDWAETIEEYFNEREQLAGLIMDESRALEDPVINDNEKTFFREVLLVIEHTAYHTGQMLVIMRLLGLHEG